MKNIITIIIILAVLVGGYLLFKGKSSNNASPSTSNTEVSNQPSISQITEIGVIGKEFGFSPASISARADERIKITFSNRGGAPHNLTIEGLDIATKTIGGGQTDVVEFTAPSSGTYAFFCSVSGHRALGMEGSLKVK